MNRRRFLAAASAAAAAGCGRHQGAQASSRATLVWPMSMDPTSLDPALVPDIPTNELLSHVYEGLVRYNAANSLEACLATDWSVDRTGVKYTFRLRDGVRFSDGRALTAADVVASWSRALLPATKSPVAANYLGCIRGADAVLRGASRTLSGVRPVDRGRAVEVTIDTPRAYFPSMLTYPTGYVAGPASPPTRGPAMMPGAGTGPYRLTAYVPGQYVALEAYTGCWQGPPRLTSIRRPIVTRPETQYNQFRSGSADFIGAPVEQYVQDRAAGRLAACYHSLPGASVDYVAMRGAIVPPLALRDVRLAIAHAINRDEVVAVAYRGLGRRADGLVPPEVPGAGPPPVPPRHDRVTARACLARAGFPGGAGFPRLTFTIIQQKPVAEAVAIVLRRNLRDNLNVSVDIQELEGAQFFAEATGRRLGFWLADWVADYPDPQNFLPTLFHSNSSLNRSGYHNAGFDALCDRAGGERAATARASLYGRANATLMSDAACIPLQFGPQNYLIQPDVRGWRVNLCKVLPQNATYRA